MSAAGRPLSILFRAGGAPALHCRKPHPSRNGGELVLAQAAGGVYKKADGKASKSCPMMTTQGQARPIQPMRMA